ncbi:MAG: hypothetical protein HUU25_00680 [Candidatus Sumerlaeia bacterium]|nr:hypothetical protein [Candidatus Sumerlaeia bacterium]
MPVVKLYFVGTGMNASRCVGTRDNADLRGVAEAHEFDLPDDLPIQRCVSKSPNQILQMGGRLVVPFNERFEPGMEM